MRTLVEDDERDSLGEEPGTGALAKDGDDRAGGEPGGAGQDRAPVHADASFGDEPADLADADAEPGDEDDVEPEPGLVHLDAEGRPKIIEVKFVVEQDFHGLRIDLYLKRKIPRLSRTRIQEIIRTQLTGPEGRRYKPHSPVTEGERLVIRRPARPEPVCPRTFGVLHDEPEFMVVDKPAGLPVHATARYYFNTLTRLLGERYPGQGLQIAHRLDRETSGCLVVARGRGPASRLKDAFEKRKVSKEYLALVRGEPGWDELEIDLPLALADLETSRLRVRMVPAMGRPDGLSAITLVRVLERRGGVSLALCRPVTGRQHQIRAHLAAQGYPIVGDKLYGHGDEAFARFCDRDASGGVPAAEVVAEFGLARQALHAASITFPHPTGRHPVTVKSPLPPDLRGYLDGDRPDRA